MINPDHFVYHAPTPTTSPKYAAIRTAEFECHMLVAQILTSSANAIPLTEADFDRVNATLREFAETIDRKCPPSADATAAIRCVRLARMAINEYIASRLSGFSTHIDCLAEAQRQLVLARFQASDAIACEGK